MKRYIISYRNEFSTVIEAKSAKAALTKVEKNPWNYEWECIDDLHPEYFEDNTAEALAAKYSR